jgi:hypothetical protein
VGEDQDTKDDSRDRRLDDLLREREHRRWLFESAKKIAVFIAAIIVGANMLWDALGKIIKSIAER